MNQNKDSNRHIHTFEFYGEPEVPLTWEEIESRCRGLWQLPSNDSSDNEPEDLRQTYANIRKRIIKSNQPRTEADYDFCWLKIFGQQTDSYQNVHSSAKYGVPMHVTGDPKTANLFVCMLNPGVIKGIGENDSLQEVLNKEDLLICETPGMSSYQIYHTADNIFSLFWKTYVAQRDDLGCEPDDGLRERAIQTFYHYLVQYFGKIIAKYDDVPETLKCLGKQNTLGQVVAPFNKKALKDKILDIETQTERLNGEKSLEQLLNLPICNVELYPFRSAAPESVTGLNIELISRLSVAVLVRRILDFLEGDGIPAPIIVLSRGLATWARAFDNFFRTGKVFINGEKIAGSADFLQRLENDGKLQEIFFTLHSNSNGFLSAGNMVLVEPKFGPKPGIKKVENSEGPVKLNIDKHKQLFGNALRVNLTKGM